MPTITNPVLPGFHPDPSICKVGDDYYIANSTFKWFGGVVIHHSRNLKDWDLIGPALTRKSQLDMAGNPASGGIWAPCLTWEDNLFWLIYTDVKAWEGCGLPGKAGFKDTHNYLVTSPSIDGPWSEPVYLNSSGFDPSLFHDDDGKKWLVNMVWDHRFDTNFFGGIVMQEYDHSQKKLTGPIKNIFEGTDRALTEGPHIYKRNGWYYLMTAEGGTGYEHAVTLARSKNLSGPYNVHPNNPLLTSLDDVKNFKMFNSKGKTTKAANYLIPGLQKAGHASMVPWTENEWILAHLCSRPLPGTLQCPLGRETGLQKITWKDDWPWLSGKGASFEVQFTDKKIKDSSISILNESWEDNFEDTSLRNEWNTLRFPQDDHISLKEKPGSLCLLGQESPASRFRQSILARRVQHFHWRAECKMDFFPDSYQQFAGLCVRYNESTQLMLIVTENNGRIVLEILSLDRTVPHFPLQKNRIPIEDSVYLAVEMHEHEIQFYYSNTGTDWTKTGPVFEAGKLSDDYVLPLGFTGMFTGLCCHDMTGRKQKAYFDFFRYIPL